MVPAWAVGEPWAWLLCNGKRKRRFLPRLEVEGRCGLWAFLELEDSLGLAPHRDGEEAWLGPLLELVTCRGLGPS